MRNYFFYITFSFYNKLLKEKNTTNDTSHQIFGMVCKIFEKKKILTNLKKLIKIALQKM